MTARKSYLLSKSLFFPPCALSRLKWYSNTLGGVNCVIAMQSHAHYEAFLSPCGKWPSLEAKLWAAVSVRWLRERTVAEAPGFKQHGHFLWHNCENVILWGAFFFASYITSVPLEYRYCWLYTHTIYSIFLVITGQNQHLKIIWL